MDVAGLLALLAGATAVVAFFLLRQARGAKEVLEAVNRTLQSQVDELREKYSRVIDVDTEVALRKSDVAAAQSQRDKLVADYARDRDLYDRLHKEVTLLEENIEDMSFGVYKPHYGFDMSDKYKQALEELWLLKKLLVRKGQAAVCDTKWSVSGSEKEGARMVKQNMKVMLRAFNGEADSVIARVSWNNVVKMEERIRHSFESINQSGTTNQIRITKEYLEAALSELRLTYEFEKKKREEQEEQREIRERMKEEERAQREFERAQQEAATEQSRFEKALAKARAEVDKATGDQIAAANAKVMELEARLAEAEAKAQRAKSMAEQTRRGYIYVISNVGSFGDRVYKIGMTRRLDPMDRILELGDASVPFRFDVHAMIYSEDAPALERAFHQNFDRKSVNLVNLRKEFFDVHIDEIAEFASAKGLTVEFTKLAEAREFRQTLSLRERAAQAHAAPSVPGPVDSLPRGL